METVKIHYLGTGVKELQSGATLIDAIYHLGAKYGAVVYNAAIRAKLIRIYETRNLILVRPGIEELEKTLNLVY